MAKCRICHKRRIPVAPITDAAFSKICSLYSNFSKESNDMICSSCMKQAHASYEFQQMVVESEKLKEIEILDEDKDASRSVKLQTNGKSPEKQPTAQQRKKRARKINSIKSDEVQESLERNEENEILDEDKGASNRVKPQTNGKPSKEQPAAQQPKKSASKINSNKGNGVLESHKATKSQKAKRKKNDDADTKMVKLNGNAWQCLECEKTFQRKSPCKRHLEIHQNYNERPFICDVCNKRFSRKGNLKSHLVVHTQEPNYCCKPCKRRFPCKNSFNEHVLQHSKDCDFVCDYCCLTFLTQDHLSRHASRHTRGILRPFTCDICSNKFASRKTIAKHMKIHMKQFQCKVCAQTFKSEIQLTTHLKKRHKKLRSSARKSQNN